MGKIGRWIYDSSYTLGTSEVRNMYRCSECELLVEKQPSTCPYCGATMSTEEEHKKMDMLNDAKGIRHQVTELIEQAYHKGYKAGVEDGKNYRNNNVIFTNGIDALVVTTLCKDCKFRTDTGICEKFRRNEIDGNFILKVHRTHDMDYCSLGKRRTK